jgi:homoserine kinase
MSLSMSFEARVLGRGDGLAPGEHLAPESHPAVVAFRSFSGAGDLALRSDIAPGRGLGYSGAARVAGLVAASVQHGRTLDASAADVLAAASALEGHPDNVAASLYGGVVVAAGGRAVAVPLAVEPAVVVWVPDAETSTDESRAVLPAQVSMADAVFNIGRASLLVAALAAGDIAALRDATADRLHQDRRLRDRPASRAALEAALDAGAWCAWVSGSGPTIAALASIDHALAIAAALPADGEARVLAIDTVGGGEGGAGAERQRRAPIDTVGARLR